MLLIANDMAMLSIALWSAYSLRLSELYVPENLGMWLLIAAAPIIGVITFHIRGLYKLVTRFIGPEGTTRIYIAVIIAVLAWAALVLMSGIKGHPRSVVVIYGLIAVGLIRLSRQWAASLLLRSAPKHKALSFDERKNVIIYGAGPLGIQLLQHRLPRRLIQVDVQNFGPGHLNPPFVHRACHLGFDLGNQLFAV